MRIKNLFITLFLCLFVCCTFGATFLTVRGSALDETTDEPNVIFVNGELTESGDGSTADTAVKTFEEGYDSAEDGDTIVLCGDITVTTTSKNTPYLMGTKAVTITGSYGGVDYAPVWTVTSSANQKAIVQFLAATELTNLTINRDLTGTNDVELFSGPSLTVGEGVKFTNLGEEMEEEDATVGHIVVRLGYRTTDLGSGPASYTQKSGNIYYIQGGNNQTDVTDSSITLCGTAKVINMLQGGGTNKNVDSSTVNISGDVYVNQMYVNGYGSAVLGSSDITITGGTVESLTATRTDATPTGKITGDVNVTIGGTANVKKLDVNENDISIEGTKNLTYSALEETLTLESGFGNWDTVTVSGNSTLRMTGIYTAPATSLTVEEGSTLILNSYLNTTLPAYEGAGSVKLEEIVIACEHEVGETQIGTGDRYSVDILMDLNSNETLQGTAVYGDYAFVATNYGECFVYSVSQNKCVGNFKFGSYTDPNTTDKAYWNHSNQMMFGSKKFNESDPFPLIYITTGNDGGHDTDGSYISKCAVERISYDASTDTWSSQLVQTIQFNDSDNIPDTDKDGDLTEMYDKEDKKFYYTDGNGYEASKGYQKVGWGWAASFVDTDPTEETKDKFYLFGARFRTTETYEATNKTTYGITDYYTDNAYIVTAFDMPDLPTSESEFGKTVTLYVKDIVAQFETEYDIFFTQGGTMYQGRIYYSFGQYTAVGTKHANGLRVFDIASEKIISRIDLSYDRDVSATGEREPECCAFYNGKLVLSAKAKGSAVGNVLYSFGFLEFHVETEATCEKPGTKYTVCGYCGETLSEVETSMGHKLTHHAATASTCTEHGTVEYWSCSLCEKKFGDENASVELDSIVAPLDGHKLLHCAATAPSCTEKGNVEYWYCTVCKKCYADETGKVGITDTALEPKHQLVKVEAKAATSKEDGNKAHYCCTQCGKLFSDAEGKKETTKDAVTVPAYGSGAKDSGGVVVTLGGCVGSVAGVGAVSLVGTLAGVLFFKKKKRD